MSRSLQLVFVLLVTRHIYISAKPPLPPAHRALHIAIFGHSHSSMIAAIAFNYYLCSTESEKNYDRLSCVRFVCVEKRFVIVFVLGGVSNKILNHKRQFHHQQCLKQQQWKYFVSFSGLEYVTLAQLERYYYYIVWDIRIQYLFLILKMLLNILHA